MDDLDLDLGSMEYLPSVREKVGDQGMTFDNHYATVALCCPSRVAMLRGQAAHNTNNTQVVAPGGSYDKFVASGENDDYISHWMQRAGYHTEYIGKLMNGYNTNNFATVPKGWDHYDGLLDPYTYTYNVPVFSTNGEQPKYYDQAYQTDIIRAKAADRLDRMLEQDQPWFFVVAPTAPHQEFNSTGRYPPVPAIRHNDLFPGLKAPRTPNFNPAVQMKPSWLGNLPLMDDDAIAFTDDTYRRRAQALVSADEMIVQLLQMLEDAQKVEDTVVVFSSDHGYHTGQHRLPAGKSLPYREDTHVPFMMKGPGIPKGQQTKLPSNHVDIAPTLLDLAGLEHDQWPPFLDGRSLLPYWTEDDPQMHPAPETINIEYWGQAYLEFTPLKRYTEINPPQNSYKTVRIVSEDYAYLYSHWCTGETELYDTVTDPYELTPLSLDENKVLVNRLNGLLLVTKTCEQDSCRDPWKTLHPDGSVHNLGEALAGQHDEYYASLPQVAFNSCLPSLVPSNEEPYFPGFDVLKGFAIEYRQQPGPIQNPSSLPSAVQVLNGTGLHGAFYQNLTQYENTARYLTEEELTGNATQVVAQRYVYLT